MARSNPAAKAWAAWLAHQLDTRGWQQSDLIKASGRELTSASVSKWISGEFGANAELTLIVAQALGTDPIDTLRAAGHVRVAETMAKIKAANAELGYAEADPVVERVTRAESLTDEDRAEFLDAHRHYLEGQLAMIDRRERRAARDRNRS